MLSITLKLIIYNSFFWNGGKNVSNNRKRYLFTKYITVGGRRIYASDYGLKAFRIEVKD